MPGFSSWYDLTEESLQANAPRGLAAVQVRRAEGLVDYPSGKSAMVWYGLVDDTVARLREHFDDELSDSGVRGVGKLQFRYYTGRDPRRHLEKVLHRFVRRFGRLPLFNEPAA